LLVLAALFAAPASAQEDPTEGARAGVEVFEPEYFAVYNPVTAIDMVRQVPGFDIAGGGPGGRGPQRRGFGGTASNVLINGERPSSKEPIFATLNRIAARNVLRIELIRGGAGAAGSDVRGQSELVNVVLRPGAENASTTTYSAELNYQPGERVWWFLRGAQSFRAHGADALLEITLPSRQNREDRIEQLLDASGDLTQTRDEFTQNTHRDVNLNAALSFDPTERDSVNLNASLSPRFNHRHSGSVYTDPFGDPAGGERSDGQNRGAFDAEIGGDWERQLTDGLSFKLVGLASFGSDEFTSVFERFDANGDLISGTQTDRSTQNGERIARGAFNWRWGEAHSIEAGLETAFNFRETDSDFSFAGPSGIYVSSGVGVDATRVEELRGEAFVSDVWVINPALTVETGFNFEASRISQSGDAQNEREFTYPKPRLIATYQLANDDQLRFTVERDVDQLDFGAFASSVSAAEGTQDDGNPDLEPEKTWRYRLNWERRFAERGSISIEAFLDQVEDVEEFTILLDENGDPRLDDDGDFIQGDGNIGDGERRGVSVDANVPFGFLGLPNATLGLGATVQDSEVVDPLTMETRPFQGFEDWRYNVNFRHDVPDWNISYGGRYGREDDSQSFRLDRIFNNSSDVGQLNLFVETTRFAGVTLRLSVDNVLDQTRAREQITLVDDRRTPSDIDEIELRESQNGRIISLRVAGTF
jgi:hypothetical protein